MIKVEIVKLPTLDSKCIKLFAMGNNYCGELGFGYNVEEMKYPRHVEGLADFIVKINCGSQHVAALTRDGKVITWGCNDEGALGRVTKSEDPNTTDENVLAFTQGLDDAVIVKVICGINKQLTFINYGSTSHIKIANINIEENHVLIIMTDGYLYTFGYIDSN
ncbi:4717_t:CDS:2 [Gigaspora margarita]|uniref:4717_t:CDS:1 n=1 Tax=Gigaspora margarita TaxID=4874 RepID=A0ABN7URD7_GIGMA|nr:4717_t:CDS:2 [Gigaspora margarita]